MISRMPVAISVIPASPASFVPIATRGAEVLSINASPTLLSLGFIPIPIRASPNNASKEVGLVPNLHNPSLQTSYETLRVKNENFDEIDILPPLCY